MFKKHLILFSLMACFLWITPVSAESSIKSHKGVWSQILQSMPEEASHSMVTEAAELALKTKPHTLKVIDLGAGTGRNMTALLGRGATVYAYDAAPESIKIMREQFQPFIKNKKLFVYQEYFEDIHSLPRADLIIAWRALSFMKKEKFPLFWQEIENALSPHGIFTGTFFGEQHETKRDAQKPHLFRLTHEEVLALFTGFQVIHFQEEIKYDEEESKKVGTDQFEHIYRIIAKKKLLVGATGFEPTTY